MSPESAIPAARWEGQGGEAWAALWGVPAVHLYAAVGSTNDEARTLAADGAPAGTVVLAEEQTRGRGRAGRPWHSPPETGLWLSVILRPDALPSPALLPLLVGVRVAAALEDGCIGAPVQIKWPNDLLVGDRKVGGILCEAVWEGDRPAHVIVGVGLNVGNAPEDLPAELRAAASSLAAESADPVERSEVAGAVVRAVTSLLYGVPGEMGEEDRAELARRDALRGHAVVVSAPGGEGEGIHGTAMGIDGQGRLLLRDEAGVLRRIESGTVRRAPVTRGKP